MAAVKQFTPKMQRAVAHYLNDPERNKVAAYRSAYDCSRMTVRTVSVKASELFAHPLVAQAVAHVTYRVMEEVKLDATFVAEKLRMLAEFNIANFLVLQPDGTTVYDFTNATEEDWYCISEYTTEIVARKGADGPYEVEKIKLKPYDRLKALELIGKLTGVKAFSENIDVNGLLNVTSLSVEDFKAARLAMLSADDC